MGLLMRSRSLFCCAASVLALAFAFAACGESDDESAGSSNQSAASGGSDKVRIALVPASHTSLVPQIALDQGFFADHDLDVTLDMPTLPFNQLPSALGKKYDLITSGTPTAINGRDNGLDLVVTMFMFRHTADDPTAALVVPPDSPAESLSDLAGKSVGAPSIASSNWTTLLCWADKEGMDPKSIRGVEAPTAQIPDLIKQGRFDAALLLGPGYTQLVKDGFKTIGDSYEKCFEGERIQTGALIGLGKWASENKDVLDRVRQSLSEAVDYIHANPEETKAFWVENSGLPAPAAEATPPHADSFAINYEKDDMLANAQKWLDVMRQVKVYDGDVKPADVVVP